MFTVSFTIAFFCLQLETGRRNKKTRETSPSTRLYSMWSEAALWTFRWAFRLYSCDERENFILCGNFHDHSVLMVKEEVWTYSITFVIRFIAIFISSARLCVLFMRCNNDIFVEFTLSPFAIRTAELVVYKPFVDTPIQFHGYQNESVQPLLLPLLWLLLLVGAFGADSAFVVETA